MIDTDEYEGHTAAPWELITNYSEENWDNKWVGSVHLFTTLGISFDVVGVNETDVQLMADAPLLLAEVKRLREKNELLRSMQRDGIEASAHALRLSSAHDRLLLEINRLREDNEKLHDAINRSFHAKISGSALEIYNGWWEGEEE